MNWKHELNYDVIVSFGYLMIAENKLFSNHYWNLSILLPQEFQERSNDEGGRSFDFYVTFSSW